MWQIILVFYQWVPNERLSHKAVILVIKIMKNRIMVYQIVNYSVCVKAKMFLCWNTKYGFTGYAEVALNYFNDDDEWDIFAIMFTVIIRHVQWCYVHLHGHQTLCKYVNRTCRLIYFIVLLSYPRYCWRLSFFYWSSRSLNLYLINILQ